MRQSQNNTQLSGRAWIRTPTNLTLDFKFCLTELYHFQYEHSLFHCYTALCQNVLSLSWTNWPHCYFIFILEENSVSLFMLLYDHPLKVSEFISSTMLFWSIVFFLDQSLFVGFSLKCSVQKETQHHKSVYQGHRLLQGLKTSCSKMGHFGLNYIQAELNHNNTVGRLGGSVG